MFLCKSSNYFANSDGSSTYLHLQLLRSSQPLHVTLMASHSASLYSMWHLLFGFSNGFAIFGFLPQQQKMPRSFWGHTPLRQTVFWKTHPVDALEKAVVVEFEVGASVSVFCDVVSHGFLLVGHLHGFRSSSHPHRWWWWCASMVATKRARANISLDLIGFGQRSEMLWKALWKVFFSFISLSFMQKILAAKAQCCMVSRHKTNQLPSNIVFCTMLPISIKSINNCTTRQ